MQIEFLETFVEVARWGSVTRAAEALFLSQPSVSGRLQALEGELGERLLTRTPRGVRLTDAGRDFLPYAERAVHALREGQRSLGELRDARAGTLTLGAAPAVSTYFLPTVLKRFTTLHPGVRLSVHTGHSEEVLRMVLSEQVQVGLVRQMRHPEVVAQPCYEDELVLLVHAAHPFRAQSNVTLEDVAGESLILFDRASSYYELTRAMFLDSGLLPTSVMELDNIEAAKKMVELGMGVALLPRIAVAREVALGILVPVPIAGAPTIHRPVLAIHRRDHRLSGPGLAFLALVRELQQSGAVPDAGQPDVDSLAPLR